MKCLNCKKEMRYQTEGMSSAIENLSYIMCEHCSNVMFKTCGFVANTPNEPVDGLNSVIRDAQAALMIPFEKIEFNMNEKEAIAKIATDILTREHNKQGAKKEEKDHKKSFIDDIINNIGDPGFKAYHEMMKKSGRFDKLIDKLDREAEEEINAVKKSEGINLKEISGLINDFIEDAENCKRTFKNTSNLEMDEAKTVKEKQTFILLYNDGTHRIFKGRKDKLELYINNDNHKAANAPIIEKIFEVKEELALKTTKVYSL